MSFELPLISTLPEQDERELITQYSAEVNKLLPVLGPLFGMGVLLFGIWDYLIDPQHALTALLVRVALVIAGSLAYLPTRLCWTPVQRCGYIYLTHASAIIICEFLLENGFLYGLAGITACVFAVSVVTLQIKTFILILSLPSLLFFCLNTINTPPIIFVTRLMLYCFSVILACILMLVIRSFRQKAFLFEKELLRLSRYDSLTGILNRSYLTEMATREFALARRHGYALSVAMLDIDRFKLVNDTYGHAIGDKVIQQLAQTCSESLRVIDHFGRIGGEEFVCVLPETSEAAALICAERLRCNIEAIRMSTPQGELRFTISIGVAVLNKTHADWDAVLKDADIALYQAKREGRNRVILAS
jgi:diguanylate cyclase (GGDEF)-like protein